MSVSAAADGVERSVLDALDRGDATEALELLVERYGQRLYRHCRQMVRDAALAEDILQTTFLEAYRDLGRFRRCSSLRTWLFGIAVHRCLDALKIRRRREARFGPLDEIREPPRAPATVEDQAAAAEVRLMLEKCVGRLEPRMRTALLLRFVEGFSYPEMAAMVGDRPATLQARVARTLPSLRRCLEQHGVTP